MLGVLLLISAKMSRTYSLEGELPRVSKNSCGWGGWEMGAKDRKEELSESKCQEPGEWMVSPGPSLGWWPCSAMVKEVCGIETGRLSWGQKRRLFWLPRNSNCIQQKRIIKGTRPNEVIFPLSFYSYLDRHVCSNTKNRRHLNIRHHHQNCPWLWCVCPTQSSERIHGQGTQRQLYKRKCASPCTLRAFVLYYRDCCLLCTGWCS